MLNAILLLLIVFIVGVSICLILIDIQNENVDPKPNQLVSEELIMNDVKMQSGNEAKKICALHKNNIAKKRPFQYPFAASVVTAPFCCCLRLVAFDNSLIATANSFIEIIMER